MLRKLIGIFFVIIHTEYFAKYENYTKRTGVTTEKENIIESDIQHKCQKNRNWT